MSNTIKVEVCDIEVTRRLVDVPAKCPGCEADLTSESALRVWEYQDQKRHSTASDPNENELDWPDVPEHGETYIQLEFQCAKCNHSLAKGKERERANGETPKWPCVSLDSLLENITVCGPEGRKYAREAGNVGWPENWYAVSDEQGGCIAYFENEVDAFAFRLMLINVRANFWEIAKRYEKDDLGDNKG